MLIVVPASRIAWADGGGGGGGAAGGLGFNGAAGTDGTSGVMGGGGGGAGGGVGGQGNGGGGGVGGTAGSINGGDGGSADTGGGGGGGYNGNGAGTATITNVAPLVGGTGGNGGAGGAGGGGGGGGGGYGAIITGAGTNSNTSTITGGNGGNGGDGDADFGGNGGSAGSGGYGIFFTNLGATFVNTGTVTGGNGGTGGAGQAAGGAAFGGIAIFAEGLSIDNTGGTITGGLNGDGVTRVPAIVFTEGANSVGGVGGTINGGIFIVNGSFMPALPGSAVGVPLTINGPLTFGGGTSFDIRITPTANDSVILTGPNNVATLAGTVVVQAGLGTYTAGTRTIISAGSLVGAFTGATSNLAFLTPTVANVGNTVELTIAAGTTGAPAVAPGVPDYRSAAVTPDQRGAATGITNAAMRNGDTGTLLTALNQLTVAQARTAFDSLSGEGIAALQNVAHRSVREFEETIFDQTTFYAGSANSITLAEPLPAVLAYAPRTGSPIKLRDPLERPRTWRAWATGFGGADSYHGDGTLGTAGQASTIYGGTLGVDYQINGTYLAGLAVGGSEGDVSVGSRSTSGSSTGGHVAFYDLANFGSFYGASSTSASFFTNKTTRNVAGFGGLTGETDHASFDSHEFRSRVEFGRHTAAYGATLTPFVALELAELRTDGFTETALSGPGNALLNLSGQSSASVPAFVGARYQGHLQLGNGMVLAPSLQLAYVHEFAPERTQLGTLTALPGSTFLVDGARPDRNAAQVKAGGELALGPSSAIFASFEGELAGKDQFYGGKGGFKVVW